MKTRVISGALIVLVVAAILTAQIYLPVILVGFIVLAGAVSVYEVLWATGICKNKIIVAAGMLPAVLVPFALQGYINIPLGVIFTVYAGIIFALTLKFHSGLNMAAVVSAICLPIVISFAFGSLCFIIQNGKMGIFHLLLVLCWSAISDTGAYFTGVLMGKHKMAKVISPKKTWEGFAGGMLFSLLFTLLLGILFKNAYGYDVEILYTLILTPLFVVLGVMGDLSASLIKRKCEIKDFGKLIPGHGGILDRFDSILMISPFFMIVLNYIQLIK